MFPASQPSEPGDLPPNGGTSVTYASNTNQTVSAATLAHTVDRIAQDYGLTHDSRQKLLFFAIQSNSEAEGLRTDILRIFACMLQNSEGIRAVTTAIATLASQLQTLTGLTRRDWQMAPAQEMSKVSTYYKPFNNLVWAGQSRRYEDLNIRAKNFVSTSPGQFAMSVHATDNTVRLVVNKYIDSECHQVRGAFCKVIFATVARCSKTGPIDSLQTIAIGLAKTYSTQLTDAPVYVQAHVAQLRLIAVDIMCAMPIPPASAPGSGSGARTKRPKKDTGFWAKVSEVFGGLVQQHGSNYESGDGWRVWEQSVIAEHDARIQNAANLIPNEIVRLFIGPNSF